MSEFEPTIGSIYSNTIRNACETHKKTLGKDFESIFNAIENACNNMNTNDFTLGNLYNTFCEIVKNIVNKITTPIAKFIYDVTNNLINLVKNKGNSVDNKRNALVESVTSMVDSTSYIQINEQNKLAYYYMSDNKVEAWCADTVRTFLMGIPGMDEKMQDEIKNIKSVSNLQKWAKEHGIYNETSSMKRNEKAQYISSSVHPGDIMIQKRNRTSHTGIVVEVYPDGYTDPKTHKKYPPGSFKTVEGNTSNKLGYQIYAPNSNILSGFINMSRYLDNNAVPTLSSIKFEDILFEPFNKKIKEDE